MNNSQQLLKIIVNVQDSFFFYCNAIIFFTCLIKFELISNGELFKLTGMIQHCLQCINPYKLNALCKFHTLQFNAKRIFHVLMKEGHKKILLSKAKEGKCACLNNFGFARIKMHLHVHVFCAYVL